MAANLPQDLDDASLAELLEEQAATPSIESLARAYAQQVLERTSQALTTGDLDNALEADLHLLVEKFVQNVAVILRPETH